MRHGRLYLIQCKDKNGYTKIGISTNVNRRRKQLQTGSPYKLKILFKVKGKDYVKRESQLHNHFRRKRLRGERFALSKEDIKYIKSMKRTTYKRHWIIRFLRWLILGK